MLGTFLDDKNMPVHVPSDFHKNTPPLYLKATEIATFLCLQSITGILYATSTPVIHSRPGRHNATFLFWQRSNRRHYWTKQTILFSTVNIR